MASSTAPMLRLIRASPSPAPSRKTRTRRSSTRRRSPRRPAERPMPPPSSHGCGRRRRGLPSRSRASPSSANERRLLLSLTPEETDAILLSLRVAVWATLCSLPPGVAVALLLARGRFWGKGLLDGIVHLPLVLPPVVTGYALLLLFGRRGPLGRLLAETVGLVFAFRWTGAALASAVMGFPLMVRAIRLSIEAVDRKLEQAAGTLGASPVWTFLVVTLP